MTKKKAFLIAGLGFGDEGKGGTGDFLTRRGKAHTIIRYNGGSQALHHVVTPEGVIHGFSQFGSGTFVPGVWTYLSRFMLVNPFFLKAESDVLNKKGIRNPAQRLTIDRYCVVITPFQRIINQMQEIARGNSRHGSCGHGVGQAMEDWKRMGRETLLVGDLLDRTITRQKLKLLKTIKVDLAEQLAAEHYDNLDLWKKLWQIKEDTEVERLVQNYYDLFNFGYFKTGDSQTLKKLLDKSGNVIFEGAQGVLLDPDSGFAPYVTKTKTTFENADKLLSESGYDGGITRIGVIRPYFTRHGAGPFPTEDPALERLIPDTHNKFNEWQGKFRIGWFDIVLARHALRLIGKIDCIALTNVDRLEKLSHVKICTSYQLGKPVYKKFTDLKDFIDFLKRKLGVKIAITSFGPTYLDKKIKDPRF